jgi:alpha-ribazole phosphatase
LQKGFPLKGRQLSKNAATVSDATIYLLRHGEIAGSGHAKRYIGQTDVSLSRSGRQQANEWARNLSGLVFDALYSSDLKRSRETVEILAVVPSKPIHFRSELREIHLGQWEGMSMTSVQSRFPEAFQARGLDFGHFRPPDGESFLDLYERVIPLFEQIVHESRGKVLIVGHAGVNRVILCHVLGLPLERLFHLGQDYGCLNTIEKKNGFLQVKALNRRPDRDEKFGVRGSEFEEKIKADGRALKT